ncbi:hypothetical protein [Streptomyces huasconensis]|uniref:hypothetical protein n=1 Tax=Streptomyces huasconensis TaxID=1854574 RepID=UPI0036FC961D
MCPGHGRRLRAPAARRRPVGPYRLLGWSFGAVVFFSAVRSRPTADEKARFRSWLPYARHGVDHHGVDCLHQDEDGSADGATPLFQSSIVSDVTREGSRTQAQALFGEALGDTVPMLPGGLVGRTASAHLSSMMRYVSFGVWMSSHVSSPLAPR